MLCVMGNILFTMFWLFFVCSYKEKTEAQRVSKVSHVLYYCCWCDLFFEVVCEKKCHG